MAKPAALTVVAMKAVTGVGAPSYASGAHMWNGTAEILKPSAMITSKKPMMNSGACDTPPCAFCAIVASAVEPVAP